MRFGKMIVGAVLLASVFGAAGKVVIAQEVGLPMLASLERGEWTVRYRDGREAGKVCLKTGYELVQLQHGQAKCNRFVVDDSPVSVTVQYTCRGNGYGRTSLRRETASLVQLESRGISGGQPFEFQAEVRRTGACR